MKKIKINGEIYTFSHKIYDPFNECYWYFVEEEQSPFCDLDEDIEPLP